MAEPVSQAVISSSVGASPSPGPPPTEEECVPRLTIAKIVCENFKSYAGVKELGPFHKVRKKR